ncbi:MAG: MATE family efflux transporter [Lachnospiraceae bacterium]|nr:MATE family efflux transporter [Lachnospiraceae bacterium]
MDMTKGRVFSPLFRFTVPLVLGNLFQLTYNAADSVIVGRFVGETALAAVGTATPLMNIGILLLNGMCMGASVLASVDYGAHDSRLLRRQLSTTLLAGMAFSVVFSLCMVLLSQPVLRLILVPDEVLPEATTYLRIVYAGLIFTFIYNFLANTLRALGDSKTPLYFLIASSLINIVSDVFFVAVLKWEVMGCAVATVLSQLLCCVFCLIYIKKRVPLLCFGKEWLIFDHTLLGKTVSYGSTSAMQQVCLQVGKLAIQAMVNTQGVGVIAAFTAVNKVDDYAYTPQQNIGHAMTTFIAQNEGAGQKDRVRKGFRAGLIIEVIYSVCLCVVIFILAERIMGLFVQDGDSQVTALGTSYLKLIAFMYILPGFTNGIQGFFRGVGDMKVTLYSTFMNMLGRCAAVYVMLMLLELPFRSLAWANMAGWVLMLLFEVPLLVKKLRTNTGAEN